MPERMTLHEFAQTRYHAFRQALPACALLCMLYGFPLLCLSHILPAISNISMSIFLTCIVLVTVIGITDVLKNHIFFYIPLLFKDVRNKEVLEEEGVVFDLVIESKPVGLFNTTKEYILVLNGRYLPISHSIFQQLQVGHAVKVRLAKHSQWVLSCEPLTSSLTTPPPSV